MDQNSVVMASESATVVLSTYITAGVTILGFIVTYFLNKRNFKEEINRQKSNINLHKMADLPYKIQELLDIAIEKQNEKTVLAKFKELMTSIFAYGSQEAIALIANMQELNYSLANNPDNAAKKKLVVYYVLLLCQVKYDLTGTEVNPEFWYRMRMTDYAITKQSFAKHGNQIVKKLGLGTFLIIT